MTVGQFILEKEAKMSQKHFFSTLFVWNTVHRSEARQSFVMSRMPASYRWKQERKRARERSTPIARWNQINTAWLPACILWEATWNCTCGINNLCMLNSCIYFVFQDIPTASVKEVYTDFYHRLVEAVSDEHTCQSLLTQLSSSALISEEKIAQLTSSKVTGSSFLKTLGLEEEPHLLVPLVSAMSGVEQLQTLAGENGHQVAHKTRYVF